MDWFSCFGGGQQGQAGGAQNSIDPATGKRKKKIRAGRMEKSTVIAAPISTVYTVITDFEHYPDWCGTGIKRMVVKDKSPGHQEIEYQTGSMGFTFYFKMFWGTSQPNVVSFRNVERQGVINLLRGDYTLTDNGDGTTKVDFLIVADCSGPIPNFIKVAIAKLIVEIALFHMKRYVESPRCTENLAKYNKLPNKFNTMRRLMTNLYTKMPGVGGKQGRFMPPLRWLRQQLVRGASITARFGAAAALLHTIIARKEPEASPAADNSRSRFGKRGAEKR